MDATMVLAIATFILAFFAAGSAGAATWTASETKRLRKDSLRPLLVPVRGIQGIGYIRRPESGVEKLSDGNMLHVHNIGAGPAENIAIRLELRPGKGSATVQLNEMLTFAEPLASGNKGLVRQWQTTEKAVEIYDDHWVVISYDDLFHRHFETEGRYIKESDCWVSIKTVQVKKLRPRVREIDYYAGLGGNL